MLTLVVDTAGSMGGVLLAASASADGAPAAIEVLGVQDLQSGEYSAQLIAAISALLDAHACKLVDVDLFAVVTGPGSFTGLRVGLSAVKALAEAMAKPVVAVSRLAVIASAAAESELLHVVLDAGRGEFYHGIYCDAGWRCVEEALETMESLSSSLARFPGPLVVLEPAVGNAVSDFRPRQIERAGVRQALPLILRSWSAGRVSDVLTLDANYLRSSEAEILARLAAHATQRSSPPIVPCKP